MLTTTAIGASSMSGCIFLFDDFEEEEAQVEGSENGEQESNAGTEFSEGAEFVFEDIEPEETTIERGEILSISAKVRNVGDTAAEKDIDIRVNNEIQKSQSVQIPSGEIEDIEYRIDTSELDIKTYDYMFSVDDSSIRGTVSVIMSAYFEFSSIKPDNETITSENQTVSATVYNRGDVSGKGEVDIQFEGETVFSENISLEPGQSRTLSTNIETYSREYEEYKLTATSPNDDISTTFIATKPPFNEPDNVPVYNIENTEDISTDETERREVDVTVDYDKKPLREHSVNEIKNISKDIVLKLIDNSPLNAISLQFWQAGQTIGAEAAFGTIDWAPNGNWSDADSVETGNYTEHEFNVDGKEYVRIVEKRPSEDDGDKIEIGSNEKFNIGYLLKNMGLTEASITGGIEEDDEVIKEFSVELDVGEEQWIEAGPFELGTFEPVRAFYLETYGADQIYGYGGIWVWDEEGPP